MYTSRAEELLRRARADAESTSGKRVLRFFAKSVLLLLAGAVCVLFAWNSFVRAVYSGAPELTYVQALAGMVLLAVLRGTWCCGSGYFYDLPRL